VRHSIRSKKFVNCVRVELFQTRRNHSRTTDSSGLIR
jgi:hypothetical protein